MATPLWSKEKYYKLLLLSKNKSNKLTTFQRDELLSYQIILENQVYYNQRDSLLESNPGDKSSIFLVSFNETFLKVKLNSFSINPESFNLETESINCFFIFVRSLLETQN